MLFQLIGPIKNIETFAIGSKIRDLAQMKKRHGDGRWRKRKGVATIRLEDGTFTMAEVDWYEASGIGRRELKIKYLLD